MFGVQNSQPIVNFENFEISQLGTALGFGGAMLLIGMLTIFAVLITLWIALTLFRYAFHGASEKSEKATKPTVSEISPVVPVAVSTPADTEIIAVLAAAIAMAESENSDVKFRVVSFKRK